MGGAEDGEVPAANHFAGADSESEKLRGVHLLPGRSQPMAGRDSLGMVCSWGMGCRAVSGCDLWEPRGGLTVALGGRGQGGGAEQSQCPGAPHSCTSRNRPGGPPGQSPPPRPGTGAPPARRPAPQPGRPSGTAPLAVGPIPVSASTATATLGAEPTPTSPHSQWRGQGNSVGRSGSSVPRSTHRAGRGGTCACSE